MKAGAKEKKIKEQAKESRNKWQRSKKIFAFAFTQFDYSLKVHSHRDLVNQCMGDWRFLFLLLSEIKIPIVNEKMRTEPTFELFLTSSDRIQKFPKGDANPRGVLTYYLAKIFRKLHENEDSDDEVPNNMTKGA